jgi:hypothetical protein
MSTLLKLYFKMLINKRIYLAVLFLVIGGVIYAYLARSGEYDWTRHVASLDPKTFYIYSIPVIFMVTIYAHVFHSSLGVHKLLKLEYVVHTEQSKWDFQLALLQLLAFMPVIIASVMLLSIDVVVSMKILVLLALSSLTVFLRSIVAFTVMLVFQAALASLLWYHGFSLDLIPLTTALFTTVILRIGTHIWSNTRKVVVIFISDNTYITLTNPSILVLLSTGILMLGATIYPITPPGVKVHASVLGTTIEIVGIIAPISAVDIVVASIAGSILAYLLLIVATISTSGMRYYDAPIWYTHYLRFKWSGFIVNTLVNYLYAVMITALLCFLLQLVDLCDIRGLLLAPSVACLVSFIVVPRWEYGKSMESYVLSVVIALSMLFYTTPLGAYMLKEYSVKVELLVSLVFIAATLILAKIRYVRV